MGSYGIWMLISSIMNVALGGSLIVTLKTLKSKTKEAEANAKMAAANADSVEIRNIGDMARMWRETAEKFEERLDQQDIELQKSKHIINQMIQIINNMNSTNTECTIQKLKKLVEDVGKS